MENATTGSDRLPRQDDGFPPVATPEIPSPGVVGRNMVRLRRADSLHRDATKIYDAARIARHHNLPHLDSALMAFANNLTQQARDTRSQVKTVQNVELTAENKSKL